MTRLQIQPADMIIFVKVNIHSIFIVNNWYVNLSGVWWVKLICEYSLGLQDDENQGEISFCKVMVVGGGTLTSA